jgi:hypothetical protein
VPDELLAADGAIRPIWAPFLDYFSRLDQAELMGRFARGDEYLRDAGVYFRQYGQKGAVDRAWPLSHVPVILHESEWQTVTAALSQRANLLESIAADLYGANTLVSNGFLPASIVASTRNGCAAGWHPAGQWSLPAFRRLRHRPWSGRAMVGAGRPRAGALRRRLRAGKPRRDGACLFGLLPTRMCTAWPVSSASSAMR